MSSTPKYLLCPDCGYTLHERVIPKISHLYLCGRCGYQRAAK